jgi:hypothetical protein
MKIKAASIDLSRSDFFFFSEYRASNCIELKLKDGIMVISSFNFKEK